MPQKKKKRFIRKIMLRYSIRKKHLRGTIGHKLFGDYLFDHSLWIPTQEGIARGIALGLFCGLLPIYGFQMILTMALAIFFRANISVSLLCTFITNPISAPGILIIQYRFGKWVSLVSHLKLPVEPAISKSIFSHGIPLMVGSLLSAVLVALPTYFIVRTVGGVFLRKKEKVQSSVDREPDNLPN